MVIVSGQVYTNIGRRKIRNLAQLAFITKCRFTAAVCHIILCNIHAARVFAACIPIV